MLSQPRVSSQRFDDVLFRKLERVFRDEGEAISPRLERVLKHRGQIGVALDRHHAPRTLQQRNSESSDSRTHFKHVIEGVKLRKLDDLLQNCIVDQEILTERMFRRKTMLLQDIARCRRSCQGGEHISHGCCPSSSYLSLRRPSLARRPAGRLFCPERRRICASRRLHATPSACRSRPRTSDRHPDATRS